MPKKVHPTTDQAVLFVNSSRRDSNEDFDAQTDAKAEIVSRESMTKDKSYCTKKVSIFTCCGRYKGIRMSRCMCIILFTSIILIALLIGILIGFYAIIPAIIRSTIDNAELAFRSVTIDEIQDDRFRLRTELELSRTGSIPAKILAPLIIAVDKLGTVRHDTIIDIKGGGSQPLVVPVDSPFIISNQSGFENFARSLIFDENVMWHLTAEASVQPISQHMPVYSGIPFDKKVKLRGLNKLQRVNIQSISLLRSDAHHIYVDLVIEIFNPSLFKIALGELNFFLQLKNQSIGFVQSVSNETILRPESNIISFIGELQATYPSEAYRVLSEVVENFLTNEVSHVEAVAGVNATSYALLAASMKNLVLAVGMPPYNGKLIPSLLFESMSLIPSSNSKTVQLSASIIIRIDSPLGEQSPLDIRSLTMKVSLMYQRSSIGSLDISQVTIEHVNITTYRAKFNQAQMILSGTGQIYEKFAQTFILTDEENPIGFTIFGTASINGSFALGPLNVDGVPVNNDVSLGGLGGLKDVHVHGISIYDEEEEVLYLSINVTIGNPGLTNVELRNFILKLADGYTKVLLGQVRVDTLALKPGNNTMILRGLLFSRRNDDLPVFGRFFSAYLNNRTQPVRLFHDRITSTNANAVELTVSGLSIEADLPGIETELIRRVEVLTFGIDFDPPPSENVHVSGQLRVLFELPSNINMSFLALKTNIEFTMSFVDGLAFGRMSLQDLLVQHDQITNELVMNFERGLLKVVDQDTFQDFAAQLVLTKNVSISVNGLAAAVASLQIGNLTLTDLRVSDTLHLTGYNRFDNGLLKINQVDITSALSSTSLALDVQTQITNPSSVYIIQGGRLTLDLRHLLSNLSLGSVIIEPFVLDSQNSITQINARGIFQMTNENRIVAQDFISAMVSGRNNDVELRGRLSDNSIGTSISLLSSAIADLHMSASVPGLSDGRSLVRQLQIKKLSVLQIAGIPTGFVKVLSTRIRLINPFGTRLTITGMNIRADFGPQINSDAQVGIVEDKTTIIINPYQELLTPYIDVKVTAKLSTMVSLAAPLISGSFGLSLTGFINVTIDNQFVLNQLALTLLNVSTAQESSI